MSNFANIKECKLINVHKIVDPCFFHDSHPFGPFSYTKKILFVVCGFAEIFAYAKTLRCHWHHRDKNDSSNFLRFFFYLNRQFHNIFDTVFVLWLKLIFDSSYKLFEEAQGFVDNVLVGDFYIWKKSLLTPRSHWHHGNSTRQCFRHCIVF